MNTFYRQEIGRAAEKHACLYLQKQGLKLITQNYHCFCGEIDIIMRDKEDIAFIEVRLKSRTDYGHPAETINRTKQRKIIRTATHFFAKERLVV